MTVRLLGLGIPWVQVGNIGSVYQNGQEYFDDAYVPIFVAHGAWAIYIALFYVRVLNMLEENRWARLYTMAVPVVMAGCVVTAFFIPYVWTASIGLGGLFLGSKLITLSHSGKFGAGARSRLGEFGKTTVAALFMLTMLGVAGASVSFGFENSPGFAVKWISWSLGASLLMTVPCITLAPYHVTRPAAAELLGLMARAPRLLAGSMRRRAGAAI